MNNKVFEELVKNNSFFNSLLEYNIYLEQDEAKKYLDSQQVHLENGEKVSINFLYDLYRNESFSYNLVELITNNLAFIKVGVSNGDQDELFYHITKSSLGAFLKKALEENKIDLNSGERRFADKLFAATAPEKLFEKTRGVEEVGNVDNEYYSYAIDDYFAFLGQDDEDYEAFFKDSTKDYKAHPKEVFIYMMLRYLKKEKIFDKYLFQQKYVDRYKELMSLQKIDLQALNKITKTDHERLEKVSLSDDLKEHILGDMPDTYDDFEKAMHVYIKMCRTFSYDDEFFVTARLGMKLTPYEMNKHNHLSLRDNKLVCFEFNLAYAKFLEELAINLEINEKETNQLSGMHANLSFRAGKFLVTADAVNSIFNGDLFGAKVGEPLIGLKCHNRNEETLKEFEEKKEKVYQDIRKREGKYPDIPNFKDSINSYISTNPDIRSVDLAEKMAIIYKKLETSEFKGMDALSYLVQLKKVLFTETEQEENFSVAILRDNLSYEQTQLTGASAIITINDKSFFDNPEDNIYYHYVAGKVPTIISKDDLAASFRMRDLEYVNLSYHQVPGFEVVEVKNDRNTNRNKR